MQAAMFFLWAMAASCGTNELAGGVPETVACNSCHGSQDNDAPPVALSRDAGPLDVRVGAHQSHLVDGEFRRAVECGECHVVPDELEQDGHLDPAPADVRFAGLGTANDATPVWRSATARCSGVYCHGSTLGGGTNTSPDWRAVGGDEVACGSCHSIPPPAPHTVDKRCYTCHEATASSSGRMDISATDLSSMNCFIKSLMWRGSYGNEKILARRQAPSAPDCMSYS